MPVHHSERVVVHGDDTRCTVAIVDYLNFTEVLTFIQASHEDFFAPCVTNHDLTVAFAHVKELTLTSLGLALLNDISMRRQQFVAHSLHDAG